MFDFLKPKFPSIEIEKLKQELFLKELEIQILKGGKENMPRDLQKKKPQLEDNEDNFDEEEVLEDEEEDDKNKSNKNSNVTVREVVIDLPLINSKLNYLIEQIELLRSK